MNGPSKDAERIARLEKLAAYYGKMGETAEAEVSRIEFRQTAADIRAVLSPLPHPAVDPAAEEVAGRLEGILEGVTSVDTPKDGCVGFMLPDMGYQRIEALGDEAATLIRSQSARIAEQTDLIAEYKGDNFHFARRTAELEAEVLSTSSRWILRLSAIREAAGIGTKPMLSEVADAIKARIAELEGALKPFAEAAADLDDVANPKLRADDSTLIEDALWPGQQPDVGDLRRAARVLAPSSTSSDTTGGA